MVTTAAMATNCYHGSNLYVPFKPQNHAEPDQPNYTDEFHNLPRSVTLTLKVIKGHNQGHHHLSTVHHYMISMGFTHTHQGSPPLIDEQSITRLHLTHDCHNTHHLYIADLKP